MHMVATWWIASLGVVLLQVSVCVTDISDKVMLHYGTWNQLHAFVVKINLCCTVILLLIFTG